jgi:hypothetical protein
MGRKQKDLADRTRRKRAGVLSVRAQYLSTGHYVFIADGVYDFGS